MSNKKITYADVKLNQKIDLEQNRASYGPQRKICAPFTYLFIKLGIPPNAITISNFFICIVGAIFLSFGTYLYLIIGILLFNLYMIFDFSDGEVARIKNKQSIEGPYFDGIGHFIYVITLGFGLGFGLYKLYQSEIYIILGFIFALIFAVEYSAIFGLDSSVIRGIIDKKKRVSNFSYRDIKKKIWNQMYEGYSLKEYNLFSKIFGIWPFPGIMISPYVISPILLFLLLIEIFLVSFFTYPINLFGQAIGLIALYLFFIPLMKLIWLVIFIYKMEKNRYVTNFLKKL